MANEREVILSVRDLEVTFGSGKKAFTAVQHVNFDVYKGETFSLVGESGSGKTTIGRAIIRINPVTDGEVFFKGKKINGKIDKELDRWVISYLKVYITLIYLKTKKIALEKFVKLLKVQVYQMNT